MWVTLRSLEIIKDSANITFERIGGEVTIEAEPLPGPIVPGDD